MNAIVNKIKNLSIWQSDVINLYGFSFLFGMLGALIIFMLVHCMEKPNHKLGTVNITGIVDHFIKIESEKSISPDTLKKEVKQFGVALDQELHAFSKENSIVLMPSEAVIAGTPDYTSTVSERLQGWFK